MKLKKLKTIYFFSLFLLLAASVLVLSVWGDDHYRDGWDFVVVEEVDDDDYWDRRGYDRGRNGYRYDRWGDGFWDHRGYGRGRNGHRYDRWDDDGYWDRRGYGRGRNGHRYDRWGDDFWDHRGYGRGRNGYGYDRWDDDGYWDRRGYGRGRNGYRYDRWDDDDSWNRQDYSRRGGYGFGFFRFSSPDENEDGIITRKEAETLGKRMFNGYDSDNSGSLSSKEFVAHNQSKAQKHAELSYGKLTSEHIEAIQERSKDDFSRLDENKDGQLSPEEFYMNHIEDSFEFFDRDESGSIEKDELRRR